MGNRKILKEFFETKNFGFAIGLIVLLFVFLFSHYTTIPEDLRVKILDAYFRLKISEIGRETTKQVGVVEKKQNLKISNDIVIFGIDTASLTKFGRWPFPRYRHANLLESFSRIKNANERERAVFLDMMFIEPEANATNDAMLIEGIEENGRVFLETTLNVYSTGSEKSPEYLRRFEALTEKFGEIKTLTGSWMELPAYYNMETPLVPFTIQAHGYGHADFLQDKDGIYRHLPVIGRLSVFMEEIRLDDLSIGMDVPDGTYEHLMWVDKNNFPQYVELPLTAKSIEQLSARMKREAPQKIVDSDGDGEPDESFHILGRYKDHFIPSINLMLALEYFNKSLDEIEVVIGKYIRIPNPQSFDVKSGSWIPYEIIERESVIDDEGRIITPVRKRLVPEIRIPVDNRGNMLINFMGKRSSESQDGYKTFPIRPYSVYAANVPSPDPNSWPKTKALGNKIIMVGTFAKGIASDEKPTPFGLMYGVEIHANALNTILMDNFLLPVPQWVDILILVLFVMLVAFMTSRMSTILSMISVIFFVTAFFITCTLLFDFQDLIVDFPVTAIAGILTFLSIVVYRVMTEEKDKKRIRNMFGKYVSPSVVDQILSSPPELGGVDKELSVLFSDIRGFTTLSETMTPQELVNHLNIYLTAMTDTIMEYLGTLDKYVGDEIMCFWGAPLPQPDHALLSCKCALKQMQVLGALNEGWPAAKRINIGIGINSGIMTVGNMGSKGRMNYTLMGDNVNLGARLEGTNKEYRTNIIISEYTYGLVKDKVIARELDNIRVKGKNKPVYIYELIDVIEGLDPPIQQSGKKKSKQESSERNELKKTPTEKGRLAVNV